MEITNNSRYYSIPLVVGRRIAQIVFFDTEGIEQHSYESSGKYQTRYEDLFHFSKNPTLLTRLPLSSNLAELKESWSPMAMLPKMYQDREVKALQQTMKSSESQ